MSIRFPMVLVLAVTLTGCGSSDESLNDDTRKCMWVSEPWRPDPKATRNVVVLLAGQQGLRQSPQAFANIVTGQTDEWRPGEHKEAVDSELLVRRLSVAGEIITDGLERSGALYGFTPGDTLILMAMDSGFNYMLSETDKDVAEDAYVDWIRGRISDASSIGTLLFAGSSRGGCLAMRLAARLLDDPEFSGARFLVGTLDGVCRPSQHECATTSEIPVHNPLNPEYFSYRTDLAHFLPAGGHDRIKVRQIVGGAEVIDLGVAGIAHSFVDTNITSDGHHWPFSYQATWVDLPHEEIGRPWLEETSGALMTWLNKNHQDQMNKTGL